MANAGAAVRRQIRRTVVWYSLAMAINGVAVAKWTITRPISFNATFYMLLIRSVVGDSQPQAAVGVAIYALANLVGVSAVVWLFQRRRMALAWLVLSAYLISVLPWFVTEGPVPFW